MGARVNDSGRHTRACIYALKVSRLLACSGWSRVATIYRSGLGRKVPTFHVSENRHGNFNDAEQVVTNRDNSYSPTDEKGLPAGGCYEVIYGLTDLYLFQQAKSSKIGKAEWVGARGIHLGREIKLGLGVSRNLNYEKLGHQFYARNSIHNEYDGSLI